MNNIPIRDIKPNVEIIDIYWYLFISFIILIIFIIMYLIIRFFIKKHSHKKSLLNQLKNLPFEDSKKTAYLFTQIAKNFINETNKTKYYEIVKKLEKYKYKPTVPPLDENIKKEIEEYVKGIK
jgi:ATP-dependent Zn protease